eukprot:scaffold13742_cov40-Tisochrysis_lutea.AAC.1
MNSLPFGKRPMGVNTAASMVKQALHIKGTGRCSEVSLAPLLLFNDCDTATGWQDGGRSEAGENCAFICTAVRRKWKQVSSSSSCASQCLYEVHRGGVHDGDRCFGGCQRVFAGCITANQQPGRTQGR